MDFHPFRPLRAYWWHRATFLMIAVTIIAVLAACGGDTDDGGDEASAEEYPRYAGAEILGSREWTEQETADFDAPASNGGSDVLVTDASLEDVEAFYAGGVEDDGWTSEGSVDADEGSIFTAVHKDDQVAFVYMFPGDLAKSGVLDAAATGLEIDESKIDDTDTVIAVSYFTCGDEDIQTCIAGFFTLTTQ